MKNKEILNVFLKELEENEIISDGKFTGTVSIKDAKWVMHLLTTAIENKCEHSSEVEDLLDRGKTFKSLRREFA